MPIRRRSAFCALLACAVLSCGENEGASSPSQAGAEGEPFGLRAGEFVARTSNLFDLGIADLNGDGRLDIYTTNHGNRQLILLGNPGGEFIDSLVSLGLSQSRDFPGLEPSDSAPARPHAGLNIDWSGRTLVLRTRDLSPGSRVRGELRAPPTSQLASHEGFEVTRDRAPPEPWPGQLRNNLHGYHFEARGDAELEIDFRGTPSVPFRLGTGLPLDLVHVGRQGIHPESPEFTLILRDRHAMAWGDYDGDTRLDAFVARGGLSGRMAETSPGTEDELLVARADGFEDHTLESGLRKRACSARQTAWVDYDRDGRLDLYIVCGRDKPPGEAQPNQLQRRSPEGHFEDVAAELGVALAGPGAFAWLDADMDGDLDLFWVADGALELHINQISRFERRVLGRVAGSEHQIRVGDFDSDGDLDLFVSSQAGGAFVQNTGNGFRLFGSPEFGLPGSCRSARWVDVDNDGWLDFHCVPKGLYRQSERGRFEAMASPAELDDKGIHAATSWFDADNDGTRDWLMARRVSTGQTRARRSPDSGGSRQAGRQLSEIVLRRGIPSGNHWLQVELQGLPGNRPAIGATVRASTPSGQQLAQVGQAEGALYSQGHYRLYFGLGSQGRVDLEVVWPDGQRQWLAGVAADQLLRITQQPAASAAD